jgi:hypothetical protein
VAKSSDTRIADVRAFKIGFNAEDEIVRLPVVTDVSAADEPFGAVGVGLVEACKWAGRCIRVGPRISGLGTNVEAGP